MRFSASRLDTWKTCQTRGYFKYVEQLPDGLQNAKASFGTVMHKVLEEYVVHRDIDQAIERFKFLWQNPEKLGVEPQVWPKFTSYGGLRERGIQVLHMCHDTWKWEKFEIICLEQEFTVPFGRHELHGFIDRVDVRTSGKGKDLLRAVDYKTNSKAPTKSELFLNTQFTVYLYAIGQPEFWEQVVDGAKWWKRVKDLHRRGIWFHLMDGRELDAGDRDDDDFGRLYRLCDQIEKAHEVGLFVPNVGAACEYCPYTEPCGVHIPTREEVAAQDGAWL